MKILGIDPALANLGYGLIQVSDGKIKYITSARVTTLASTDLHHRLYEICCRIEEVIQLHLPDLICMEETFVNNNAISSLKLANVRGAIMSLIAKYNINYSEFKPNKIKKSLTGTGHASKDQIMHMINVIISNLDKKITHDEADALAVAYTGYTNRLSASMVLLSKS